MSVFRTRGQKLQEALAGPQSVRKRGAQRKRNPESKVHTNLRRFVDSKLPMNPVGVSAVEKAGLKHQRKTVLNFIREQYNKTGFYPSKQDLEKLFKGIGKYSSNKKEMQGRLDELHERIKVMVKPEMVQWVYNSAVRYSYLHLLLEGTTPDWGWLRLTLDRKTGFGKIPKK
ncbi:MAG: hypothetical protein NUV57_03615 [archaeon]|nr:hypothetical protein [archaeon]